MDKPLRGREPVRPAPAPAVRPEAGAPLPDFGRSLPMQLMRARELVMQRFRGHLHRRGLTEQQWRIIRALVEPESLEVSALSAHCCIHAASLSRILPKLERDGILTRTVNQRDQRRIVVALTEQGAALFHEIAPESVAIYQAIADQIGTAELERIYRSLDHLIETLSPRPELRASR
jgi:homoprotocatechuate degradation regulator HpaR